MGLIKENYEIKDLGITLSKAYAKIERLTIIGDYAMATFYVQKDRQSIKNKKPLEVVDVEFVLNYPESPTITAYNTAKGMKVVSVKTNEDGTTEKVFEPNYFYGWDDDIV